jgi:ribonuclease VapC
VEDLLYLAQEGQEDVFMNMINLGEVFYRCARAKDIAFARDILDKIKLLPLKVFPCSDDLVMRAAEIKAEYAVAYADALALATALRENARIVTGDPEFKLVRHLVEIEWIH